MEEKPPANVKPWSADDIARLQAEQREMALLTYEAGLAAAREEARERGYQKGLHQGRSLALLELAGKQV